MNRRVLSLCSGAGGLDYGLEQAGWTVAAQAEIDPAASAVLAARFPDVPNLGDAVTLAEHPQPLADLGPFGLLAAGFPCQDLSSAGRRRGLTAARSGLFFAVVAVARATRPSAILLENVPGLLSSGRTDPADGCVHSPQPAARAGTLFTVDDGGGGTGLPAGADADGWDDHERGCPLPGADFGRVLGELTAAGYGDIAWRTVDSLHMGVPQRRRRVLLVAFPDGAGQARRVLCDPEGTPWRRPHQTAGPVAAGLFDTATVGRSPRRTAHLTDRLLDGRQPFVWSRSGFVDGGWVWDADATDHPITAPAAVLADVLEPDQVPVRYYLSPTACAGVLRRAVGRGRALPAALTAALHAQTGGDGDSSAALTADDLADTVSTVQAAGGGRGWRVDAEAAAGGHLIPVAAYAVTAREGKGPNSDANSGTLIPVHASTLTAGGHAPAVAPPGRRAEDDRNLVASTVTASAGHHGHSSPQGDEADNLISVPFRKTTRVHGPDTGDERWADDGHANTLDTGNAARTSNVVVAFESRCEADPTADHAHPATGSNEQPGLVVSPVDLRNALRNSGATGVGTPGTGIGEDGDPSGTVTSIPPAVATARVRRLLPVETERLQGLPDGWTEPAGADSHRYACVGNAVTTTVARWAGERILTVLDDAPETPSELLSANAPAV